jgi:hypothetical protein
MVPDDEATSSSEHMILPSREERQAFMAPVVAYETGLPIPKGSNYTGPWYDLREIRGAFEKFLKTGSCDLDIWLVDKTGKFLSEAPTKLDALDVTTMAMFARHAVAGDWKRLQNHKSKKYANAGQYRVKSEAIARFALIYQCKYEVEMRLLDNLLLNLAINDHDYQTHVEIQKYEAFQNAKKVAKLLVELLNDVLPMKPGPKKLSPFKPEENTAASNEALVMVSEAYSLSHDQRLTKSAAARKVVDSAIIKGEFDGDPESRERRIRRRLGAK